MTDPSGKVTRSISCLSIYLFIYLQCPLILTISTKECMHARKGESDLKECHQGWKMQPKAYHCIRLLQSCFLLLDVLCVV